MRLDEAARREAIHRSLERVGRATVRNLAQEFRVSTVTIRKDLSALERRGLLTRVHGGATRTTLRDEGSFPYRLLDAAERKQDIARRAARLVRSGDSVALDSSSTAHYLARELLDLQDFTLVTNSFPTATLFMDGSAATVHFLGGVVRRSSRATAPAAGPLALLPQTDIGFFSADSVSMQAGIGEVTMEEARSKKRLAAGCRRRYLIVDSSKFSRASPYHWLHARGLTGLITDQGIPPRVASDWRALGLMVDVGPA